jgi:hypothetical protein
VTRGKLALRREFGLPGCPGNSGNLTGTMPSYSLAAKAGRLKVKRLPYLAVAIFFLSVLLGHTNLSATTDTGVTTSASAAAVAPDFSSIFDKTDLDLAVNAATGFDYAKCIESCDSQYSACAKGGDADKVKYCSNQHDRCRKACLEHK